MMTSDLLELVNLDQERSSYLTRLWLVSVIADLVLREHGAMPSLFRAVPAAQWPSRGHSDTQFGSLAIPLKETENV